MPKVYVSSEDNRSYAYTKSAFGGESYQAPEPPGDISGRSTFDIELNKWILDPPYGRTHDDDVRDAQAHRRNLVAEAEKIMSGWILDLNLGMLNEEDKQKLIDWRLYVKELDTLNIIDDGFNVKWPNEPSMQTGT